MGPLLNGNGEGDAVWVRVGRGVFVVVKVREEADVKVAEGVDVRV